jgi:hypothetical protein
MGSFRNLDARKATDTDTLTEGLGEDESITYWKVLPHSAQRAISSAAAKADIDKRGRMQGIEFDSGAAALTRLSVGIISWSIKDEAGNWVPWDAKNAAALLDGLPPAVVTALTSRIGAGDPEPALESEADGDDSDGPPGETVGEDFAGNSEPSSEDTPRHLDGSTT